MKKLFKTKKNIALLTIIFLLITSLMPLTPITSLATTTTQLHSSFSDVLDSTTGKVSTNYAYGTMFYSDATTITGYIDGDKVNIKDGMIKDGETAPKYYYEVQSYGNTYNNSTGADYQNNTNGGMYNSWATGGTYRDLANRIYNNGSKDTEGEKNNIYVYGLKATQELKLEISNCAIDKDGDLCDVVATVKINTIDKGDYNTAVETQESISNNWLARDFLHTNSDGYDENGVYNCTYNRENFYSQYYYERLRDGDYPDIWLKYGAPGEKIESFRSTTQGANFTGYGLSNKLISQNFADMPRGLVAVTNDEGLVSFTFLTNYAGGEISFEYYKHNSSTEKANITDVMSVVNDIDSYQSTDFESNGIDITNTGLEQNGREYVSMDNGNIYYNSTLLSATEDGVFREKKSDEESVNTGNVYGITTNQYTSIIATQNFDNKDNTQFKIKYSSLNCGIGYRFLSPFETEMPSPTKTINKDKVFEEEDVEFTISQYIPNNYFAYNTNFSDLFFNGSNLKEEINIPTIKIQDTFDSNINVDFDNVKIIDEKGDDVTSYFDIIKDGQTLTATIKEDSLKSMKFYNKTYNIKVPAKVIKGTGEKINEVLQNTATLVVTPPATTTTPNPEPETKNTNTVNVNLQYNYAVIGEIDHGTIKVNDKEDGLTSKDTDVVSWHDNKNSTVTFTLEKNYKIVNVTVDDKEIDVNSIDNTDGIYSYSFKDENIDKDIEHKVVVTTELKDSSVLVKYIDKTTGEEISEQVEKKGKIGDSFDVGEDKKEIDGYTLVEEPEEKTGNMTEETQTFIYYYTKNTKVIEKHIDEITGKVIEETTYEGNEGDKYETKEKEFEGYDIVKEKYPANSTGNMTGDVIEVDYYYIRKAKVVVKYLEEGTNEVLEKEEIIEGHQNDTYSTKEKEIQYYKLVEEKYPENAKGKMEITENEDGTIDNTTEVIYYYKKLSFNMKVDKWIEKVTVNGETKSGNDIENNSIVKLEIYRKEIKNTKVKVEYKIRITNTEELEGYVGQVIDKIPSGLIFNAEDNEKYWTLDGDKITADLSDEVIKPGEYKELKVVLTWDQDAENLTVKTNKASIKNVTNAAKYEETTTEDNEAETGLLITVSTGENKEKVIISIQLLSTALMLIGSSIVIMKKK